MTSVPACSPAANSRWCRSGGPCWRGPAACLLDEPSIGLAPKLFQDLLRPIRSLQQQHGLSILLIEQNVREALKISDRVVVMKAGAVILEAAPGELADNARLMELY